jgi:hypothetical protein
MLTGGSLIQTSRKRTSDSENRRLDAVVFLPETQALQHYICVSADGDDHWLAGTVINRDSHVPVIGPAWIMRSRFGRAGNFEVVVPEIDGLAHYWLDNDQPDSAWERVGIIAPGSTGAGALIQNRVDHSFELVVLHGRALYHYRLTGGQWVRTPTPITEHASGAPALIQSDYASHLEVVVLEGTELVLYWRDQEVPGFPWRRGGTLASGVTGPAGFVQGPYGTGAHRNFELVVPQDDTLTHLWRDNSSEGLPVRYGGVVTYNVGGIAASALAVRARGEGLDVLAQERECSIIHYMRSVDTGHEWVQQGCLPI